MNTFDDIARKTANVQGLDRISAEERSKLQLRQPHLPRDYIRFLAEIGTGDLGGIRLFGGPTASSEIYPNGEQALTTVLLFGDDFQGYCFGFDTADGYRVVEVDPRGRIDRAV